VKVEHAEDTAATVVQNVERPENDVIARFRDDEGGASYAVCIVFQVNTRIGDA